MPKKRVWSPMKGGIRKRVGKNGTCYLASVNLGYEPETGKRLVKSASFTRREDAVEWRNKELGKIASGIRTRPGRQSLAEYLQEWMNGSLHRRQDTTQADLAGVLRKYVLPARISVIRLRDLQTHHIRGFYESLPAEGTVRHRVHRALYRALQEAVNHELLDRNPSKPLPQQYEPIKDSSDNVWTTDKIVAFLKWLPEVERVGWSKRYPTGSQDSRPSRSSRSTPAFDLASSSASSGSTSTLTRASYESS